MTITDAELAQLAGDVERDYVERKAASTDTEKVGQTICALANDPADRAVLGSCSSACTATEHYSGDMITPK
ncbi:MAG TPA: hypothetical protein VFX16_30000 [Pseudonocardiaceae bacterium]|nr:hypothetical protein [Pseudonocardiaceae bacterium]